MTRHIFIYGSALAGLALLTAWMDWQNATQAWSTSFYVLCVAVLFAALGVWLGLRLAPRPRGAYVRNTAALASLGISPRECEVLDLLAEGASNKLIARRLSISPNTVKTHVSRLLEKFDAQSRTQLVSNARQLRVLP